MRRPTRLLLGISVFWLALSLLLDGINTLVLPIQLGAFASQNRQATLLGLLTFFGLLAGALIQPIAGACSDRWQPALGRRGFIGIGLLFSLAALFFFAFVQDLAGLVTAYLAIQVAASIAQAGQQGLIPDLVPEARRGLASGWKGFMDLSGAMLGFVLLGQLLGAGQKLAAVGTMAAVLVIAYLLAVLLTPQDRPGPQRARPRAVSLGHIFRIDLHERRAFVRLIAARFLFLLGIYGTGRFLLFFVASRLGLSEEQAAQQAGALLAGLALISILASPLTGWFADRFGRAPLMIGGSLASAAGALLLIWAETGSEIFLFAGLMSLGSSAFASGSWALLADLAPKNEPARFFGLANFSTAGSAAAAGLLGPLIDWADRLAPGSGFTVLFIVASMAFLASSLPLRGSLTSMEGEKDETEGKVRSDASGLALLSLPADPAGLDKVQDPPRRTTRL